ncbi:MAG: GNAT family N-acetyltransferase [Blastocatellia bacterium]
MEIKNSQFLLRAWREGDEHALARHANHPGIARWMRDIFPHPYTVADGQRWISIANAGKNELNFAIDIDGETVGGVGLITQTDIFHRSAEIGYWIGKDFQGRGIVTAAVRAITDFAFANLDLCRIWAGVFENNAASARVLEKAGFAFEARMRRHVTKNGVTMDLLLYAIVR